MNENIIVALIVVVAAVYMLKRLFFKKKSGTGSPCDGCGRCGGSKAAVWNGLCVICSHSFRPWRMCRDGVTFITI